MKLLFCTRINKPLALVKSGFKRELFVYLTPQLFPFDLQRFDGCKKGDEFHINLKTLGMSQKWLGVITQEEENPKGWSFTDQGKILPWPLSHWKHHHRIDRIGENACEIVDAIEFQTSPRILGPFLYPVFWATFAIRPKRYKKYFEV